MSSVKDIIITRFVNNPCIRRRVPAKNITLFLFSCIFLFTGLHGTPEFSVYGKVLQKKIKQINDTSGVSYYIEKALLSSRNASKIELTKAYIDTAESICRNLRMEHPAMLYLARAGYFLMTKDYSNASAEAQTALQKAESLKDKETQARVLTFFGKYYLRTGFFNESLTNFSRSNLIAEKEGLKKIIPRNYLGMADVYESLKRYPEFQENLINATTASEAAGDTSSLLTAYFRLGSLLTEKARNFRKADSVFKRCVSISIQKKDSVISGVALANMGWNFYLRNDYDSALFYYKKSLLYSLPGKRYSTSANSYGNIGTIYRDLGKPKESLEYYNKSLDMAKLADDTYTLYWVYRDISDMYLGLKDTAKAYTNYVLFKKYSDIDLQRSNVKGLDDATARFEAESRRTEVELLSLKLREQRLIIYGSTCLFILVLSTGILIFSRAKINARRRISEMDRKISEITQANLRQQMNPHFIFNTLNSIQYYMYQHDKLSTNNYLTKFSNLMRKVLENSQYTSIPVKDELDALRLYLDLEMMRFKNKFDYKIVVDEEIDTMMYKIPTMLIQPYVENSISHGLIPAETQGHIKIEFKLERKHISCIIEDNGIGRKAAQERKPGIRKEHNSLGTRIVSSRLDLVNAFYGTSLKTVFTDLKDEHGNVAGTMVKINIPILS